MLYTRWSSRVSGFQPMRFYVCLGLFFYLFYIAWHVGEGYIWDCALYGPDRRVFRSPCFSWLLTSLFTLLLSFRHFHLSLCPSSFPSTFCDIPTTPRLLSFDTRFHWASMLPCHTVALRKHVASNHTYSQSEIQVIAADNRSYSLKDIPCSRNSVTNFSC